MGRTRALYPPEFRRQMINLVRAGRDPDDLAREYEPTAQSIHNWVASAGGRMGERPEKVLTPDDADELVRLRRDSRGRPALCRLGLRVHERALGQLPGHRHGARAWGLDGGVLRVAQAATVRTR